MITLHQTDRVAYHHGVEPVHLESPDVVINPNYIVAMIQYDGRTSVSMVNGNTFNVKESVKDIIEKMSYDLNGLLS